MTRYEPNRSEWDKIVMSPEIQEACLEEARKGQRYAESIAPRSGDDEGVPYADSFDVEAVVVHWFGGPRVAARLVNDAPHAAALEFGNKRTPHPHRVLGRTAEYLGGS